MTNKVIDSVGTLDLCSNEEIGITYGRWYRTEIVDKQHGELDQAIGNDDSDYNWADENSDTYNYDDDYYQYDYYPETVITVVNPDNNNPPPQKYQEFEENVDNDI